MARSVARGSTWQRKPDSQLHSTGLGCILQVGPEVHNGNSCAGINRHEVENARVSRERGSDPLGLEFCAGHREVHSEA
jgi:hypothetical protein